MSNDSTLPEMQKKVKSSGWSLKISQKFAKNA